MDKKTAPRIVSKLVGKDWAAKKDGASDVLFLAEQNAVDEVAWLQASGALVEAGVLGALVEHVLCVPDNTKKTIPAKEVAIIAIGALVAPSSELQVMLVCTPTTINAIIKLLSDGPQKLQENAAQLLTQLSANPQAQSYICGNVELLEAMSNVMTEAPDIAQEGCIMSICNLATTRENQLTIAGADGMLPAIVNLLCEGSLESRTFAALAVANLSAEASIQQTLGKAKLVFEQLARLAKENSPKAKEKASMALVNLALNNKPNKIRIAKTTGTLASMVGVLTADVSPKTVQNATMVLASVAALPECVESLAEVPNVVQALLNVMQVAPGKPRDNATIALRSLILKDDAPDTAVPTQQLQAQFMAVPGCMELITDVATNSTKRAQQSAVDILTFFQQAAPVSSQAQKTAVDGVTTLAQVFMTSFGANQMSAAKALLALLEANPLGWREMVAVDGLLNGAVQLLGNENAEAAYLSQRLLRGMLIHNETQSVVDSVPGALDALVYLVQFSAPELSDEALIQLSTLTLVPETQQHIASLPGFFETISAALSTNGSAERQECAALLVSNVYHNSIENKLIVGSRPDLVDGVLLLLANGSPAGKENAATALSSLVLNCPENQASMLQYSSALPSFVLTLQIGTVEAKTDIAWCIGNVCSQHPENQKLVAENPDCIRALLEVCKLGSFEAMEAGVWALHHITQFEEAQAYLASFPGFLDTVVDVLQMGTEAAKTHATWIISNLALNNPENQSLLGGMRGVYEALATNLTSTGTTIRESAASALCNLTNEKSQGRVGGMIGVIPSFVELVSSNSRVVAECAALALGNLSLNHPENARAISEHIVVVDGLFALILGSEGTAQENALWTLGNLSQQSKDVQKEMGNSNDRVAIMVELARQGSNPQLQHRAAICIMHAAQTTENVKRFGQSATDVLRQRGSELRGLGEYTEVVCCVALALLTGDDEQGPLAGDKSQMERLERTLSRFNHEWIVSVQAVLGAIKKVATADANKAALGKAGAVSTLLSLISGRLVEAKGKKLQIGATEKLLALSALWDLSFERACQQRIIDEEGVIQLAKLATELGFNAELECLLWFLKMQTSTEEDEGTIGSKVLLSHHTNDHPHAQDMSIVLVDDHNLEVIVDDPVATLDDELVQRIISPVKDASVVVVCLSPSMKSSNFCRLQIEYAAFRKKPFVFVLIQEGYWPDGWLGQTVGRHAVVKVTPTSAFETQMKELAQLLRPYEKNKLFAQAKKSAEQPRTETTASAAVSTPAPAPAQTPAPTPAPVPVANSTVPEEPEKPSVRVSMRPGSRTSLPQGEIRQAGPSERERRKQEEKDRIDRMRRQREKEMQEKAMQVHQQIRGIPSEAQTRQSTDSSDDDDILAKILGKTPEKNRSQTRATIPIDEGPPRLSNGATTTATTNSHAVLSSQSLEELAEMVRSLAATQATTKRQETPIEVAPASQFWSVEQVCAWLATSDLVVFVPTFFDNQINGRALSSLTKEALQRFGFEQFQVERFCSCIEERDPLPKPNPQNMASWTTKDVCAWLALSGLVTFVPGFFRAQVVGDNLPLLTDSDLQAFGMQSFHINRFRRALA